MPPRQLESRSAGRDFQHLLVAMRAHATPSRFWRGWVREPRQTLLRGAVLWLPGDGELRWLARTRRPSCQPARTIRDGWQKGQPVGELYPHFARADCYAHPIARPWLLSPSMDEPANPSIYRRDPTPPSCLSAVLVVCRATVDLFASLPPRPPPLLTTAVPTPHASSVLTTTFSCLPIPACCAALPTLFAPRLRRPARIQSTGPCYSHLALPNLASTPPQKTSGTTHRSPGIFATSHALPCALS